MLRRTIAVGLLVTGCLASDPPRAQLDDDEARALLAEAEAADYRSWDPPPTSNELPRRRAARGPHGDFVEVYLNSVLIETFFGPGPLEAWPVGVSAVCESYTDAEVAEAFLVQVMTKTEAGWQWAQLDAQGRVLTDDPPDDCIGCHGAAEDFVFSLFLPRE